MAGSGSGPAVCRRVLGADLAKPFDSADADLEVDRPRGVEPGEEGVRHLDAVGYSFTVGFSSVEPASTGDVSISISMPTAAATSAMIRTVDARILPGP